MSFDEGVISELDPAGTTPRCGKVRQTIARILNEAMANEQRQSPPQTTRV